MGLANRVVDDGKVRPIWRLAENFSFIPSPCSSALFATGADSGPGVGRADCTVSAGGRVREKKGCTSSWRCSPPPPPAFDPQCMNADRASAYHAAYDAQSLNEALAFEFDHGKLLVRKGNTCRAAATANWHSPRPTSFLCQGMKVLGAESVPGARRFAAGEGRGGR
jgi:hypothetical protein